jgi:hypothetical protein
MADESIRSEPAFLAKAAAQDDQEDRAAPPAPAVSLRVVDVPAPVPATVDSANETVSDVLDAIPEGSSVSFSADQLAFLLSAGEAIRPASEAHARVERFARACGCSFLFRHQAGTGIFTKDKGTPKTAVRAGTTEYLAAPQAKLAHFLNITIVPPLLTRWVRKLPPDAVSSAANSNLQWRSSRRSDELERQFHPEWGFLAPRRNFLGTLRVVLIASAIGALSGGGIVLWMEGGAPADTGSVAARTLVPPEVEARDKSSETTSSVLPAQRQRELPLEASKLNTPETTQPIREGEAARSEMDANPPARRPNAVQVETAERRDHAPESNGELGATGSKSRQASSLASPLPTDQSKRPQMAGRPASQRELVPKKPKMPELIEKRSNQRDARNGDLSPFFRPWW